MPRYCTHTHFNYDLSTLITDDRFPSSLSDETQRLIELAFLNFEERPQSFARSNDNYLENMGILIGTGSELGPSLSYCSHNHNCKRPRFCPKCAYIGKIKALQNYLTAYEQRDWAHLIITKRDPLLGDELFLYDTVEFLQEASNALTALLKCNLIHGALRRWEIGFRFMPLKIWPHLHALVDLGPKIGSPLSSKSLINEISMHGANVELKPIESRYHFMNTIQYLYKSYNIFAEYKKAIDSTENIDLFALNQEALFLIEFIDEAFAIERATGSMGSLHHASTESLMSKKSNRPDWDTVHAEIIEAKFDSDLLSTE